MLVRYAFVRAQQDVETILGQAQQLAVILAGPAGLRHRNNLVLPDEIPLEPTVHVLVKEYTQLGYSARFPYRRPVVVG